MSARLRRLAVQAWRLFTGPASVLALLIVAAYLFFIACGPPLLALWLVGHGLFAAAVHHEELHAGRLALELLALAFLWYLARRFLPPFRWRF